MRWKFDFFPRRSLLHQFVQLVRECYNCRCFSGEAKEKQFAETLSKTHQIPHTSLCRVGQRFRHLLKSENQHNYFSSWRSSLQENVQLRLHFKKITFGRRNLLRCFIHRCFQMVETVTGNYLPPN